MNIVPIICAGAELIVPLLTSCVLVCLVLELYQRFFDFIADVIAWYDRAGHVRFEELQGRAYIDIIDDFIVVLSPDGYLHAKRKRIVVRLRVKDTNGAQHKLRRPNWRVVETLVKIGVRYVPPEGVLK